MAIYMKIDGLLGGVTTESYEHWIECDEIEFFGINNNIMQSIGHDMDRVINHPQFGEISIKKTLDASSIGLFEFAHNRKPIKKIEIHQLTTGDPLHVYAKLLLEDVIICHYSEFNSNTQITKPREHIRFAYTSIQKTYTPLNSDNTPGSPIISGFDLTTGEPM